MRASAVRRFLIVIVLIGQTGCEASTDLTSDHQAIPSANRIVTLSPHLAELLFEIGAGSSLIGVSAYSDYPEEVGDLPVVGDAFAVDLEQLAILRPELLVAWESGTPDRVVDELRAQGYRVAVIRTASLADVSSALRELGELTGHVDTAIRVAAQFEADIRALAETYSDAAPIRVFYQIARQPLYTISHAHYVSDLIRLCGGINVFADLGDLAPMISTESVLERDPELLLASTDAGPDAFDDWDRWTDLSAIRFDNKFHMPADEIGRATPRLLIAAKALCAALDDGRSRRDTKRVAP